MEYSSGFVAALVSTHIDEEEKEAGAQTPISYEEELSHITGVASIHFGACLHQDGPLCSHQLSRIMGAAIPLTLEPVSVSFAQCSHVTALGEADFGRLRS